MLRNFFGSKRARPIDSIGCLSKRFVVPFENFVDSVINVDRTDGIVEKLRRNASEIEENSKVKSWKKGGSVPWGSSRNGRTSDIFWAFLWNIVLYLS